MGAYRSVFLFGFATFVLAITLVAILPSTATLADGYQSPIIAFEFARNASDLAFLVNPDLNAATNRAAMRTGLYWDMAFPVAYAGLLISVWCRLMGVKSSFARIGLMVGVLIIPADYLENWLMLDLLSQASSADIQASSLAWLHVATWLKWGLIAVMIGLISLQLARASRWPTAALGGAVVIISIACLASNTMPILAEIMAQLIGLFFLALLVSEILDWRRSKKIT